MSNLDEKLDDYDNMDLTEGMRAGGESVDVSSDVEIELIKRRMPRNELELQKNRECVFDFLKNQYSRWRGPQYRYNIIEDNGGINRLIDEWISNLKKDDNLEKLKQTFNEFKKSPRPTRQEEMYPFFVLWCSKFNNYMTYFDATSLIEKYYPTNSHVMTWSTGANLVIQLIECLINLASNVISLEKDKLYIVFNSNNKPKGGKTKKNKHKKKHFKKSKRTFNKRRKLRRKKTLK